MSTWPIRADGSATFNDAILAGAAGIGDAPASMSYATMIANIATQLNDSDIILFGGQGGEYTATGDLIITVDNLKITGELDPVPIINMSSLYLIQVNDGDNSNIKGLIIKNPLGSGIEWISSGSSQNLSHVINSVYISGSDNQAFSVEPGVSDTINVTADRVYGVDNFDDGWSMHEGAVATVTNSVFSGNSQGLGCIAGSQTTMINCVFLNNTFNTNSADVFMTVNKDNLTNKVVLKNCYLEGNIAASAIGSTRVVDFTADNCTFAGKYYSSSTSVNSAVINIGVSSTINSVVIVKNNVFFGSELGKRIMLLRGVESTILIENNKISNTVKNSTQDIFTQNDSNTIVRNNYFTHIAEVFNSANSAIISNNNFLDVDVIGGSGATIADSTNRLIDNAAVVAIAGVPDGSSNLILVNAGGRVVYNEDTSFVSGVASVMVNEFVGEQLYGLARDLLTPSKSTAPIKLVVT